MEAALWKQTEQMFCEVYPDDQRHFVQKILLKNEEEAKKFLKCAKDIWPDAEYCIVWAHEYTADGAAERLRRIAKEDSKRNHDTRRDPEL